MCFTSPMVLSNASIPQWPVRSNGAFLTGRLGVSQMCIYQKRIVCREITHQVPLTWFSMLNVPYRPIQPSFLSGRLGVMGVPHWPVESLPFKTDIGIELCGQIIHINAPQDDFQCLMCFTWPIVLSNAAIPQWPVGSNGVFLTGRLGHMMHISRKDHLSRSSRLQEPATGRVNSPNVSTQQLAS